MQVEYIKSCADCREQKPPTDFSKNTARKDGLDAYCRACRSARSRAAYRSQPEYRERMSRRGAAWYQANRERVRESRMTESSRQTRWEKNLIRSFGITSEEYDRLSAYQNYVCAICLLPERAFREGAPLRLAVDHCHDTGRVRGLLCTACNTAIGKLSDDPERMRRAAEYVESGGN